MKNNKNNTNILILTNSQDTHTNIVTPHIQKLGGEVYRINTDKLSKTISITIKINTQAEIIDIKDTKKVIPIAQIKSVWIRRPFEFFYTPVSLKEKLTRQELTASHPSINKFSPPECSHR